MKFKFNKIEYFFSKWWGKIALILLFFISPYSQIHFSPQSTQQVIGEVLKNPIIYAYPIIYKTIKITFSIIVILLIINKRKFFSIFSFYTSCIFMISSLFQNMAYTEKYGFVFLIGNFILVFMLAILWCVQCFSNKENNLKERVGKNKYWLIPLSVLAFWFPIDSTGRVFNFTLLELITNESMTTFCMITPVVLVISLLFCKKNNLFTLTVTSYIGIIFGITNMIVWFIINPEMWSIGVLHLPLIIISLYTFIICNSKKVT
ncbi:hypothetical protein ACFIJ5_05625 [Haloimpatiens sp. FM7330]|uniref:hypothetical protein n=1 Tax=Haloimpatiens sp. FM7330 TaxID=3298610 RepID=UPI003644E36C